MRGKTIITVIIGICSIFLFSFNLWATEYYVDYSTGNDSNNGISTSMPFKHSPGDNNATNSAGSTTLSAGDTVYFKGGVVYQGFVLCKWDGSSGNEIIYDGNSAENWGSGKAIMDGNSETIVRAFEVYHDYIIIRYFEIRNYLVHGIAIHDNNYTTFEDSYIHDLYDWDLSDGTTSNHVMNNSGTGLFIQAATNVIIDNIEITKTGGVGIAIKEDCDTVEVKNSSIHEYITWYMNIYPKTYTMQNIYIHDNKFYNLYHYSASWWTSTADEKVQAGTGSNPHQDGIFIRNPSGGTLTNIRVYNNEFYLTDDISGDGSTALFYFDTPKQTGGVHDTIYVYNNTFQSCYAYDAFLITDWTGGRFYIYNNTFFQQKKNAIRLRAGNTNGKVYIKNNIFDQSVGGGSALRLTSTLTIASIESDYNIFNVGSYVVKTPYNYSTLEGWQNSGYGQDAHSIETTDSKFVDAKSDVTGSEDSDFRLQATSPAIDAGTDLGEDYNIDRDGIYRPQGIGWDIGAYEGSSITPESPENLRLISP